MISDSTLREFQYVIVWKIDRFSRDKFDSVKYKYALKSSGVSVISATEPIDGSPGERADCSGRVYKVFRGRNYSQYSR